MSLAQATNESIVEGILLEKNVRKDLPGDAIAGNFVLSVDMGNGITSEIPIEFYATPMTKATAAKPSKENPAYKGINNINDNCVSLAECLGDASKATRLRVRNAQISENIFPSQDGTMISYPRIRGNFFDIVKQSDFAPKALFKVKMIIKSIVEEQSTVDGNKEDTGRLIITGGIVNYNHEIEESKFIVENQKYVDFVNRSWAKGYTVNATGIILITSKQVEEEDMADGFGEPMVRTFTRRIREFKITNGSPGPVEGYDDDEIDAAWQARKSKIAKLKDEQAAKANQSASSSSERDW
jgi:hypothetical protein